MMHSRWFQAERNSPMSTGQRTGFLMAVAEDAWFPPSADMSLSSDDVHLWRAALDLSNPSVQQLVHLLSDAERARAKSFRFEPDRKRFIVARGVLRTILGHYLGIEPDRLRFHYGPRGKPYLADGFSRGTLQFNLSHSNELALYAFTRGRQVGVDLEYIRSIPDVDQIAAEFFSARENTEWQTLQTSQKQETFFNWWTRKEAYGKARGEGLEQRFDRFDVSLALRESPRRPKVEREPEAASRWSLGSLAPARGYKAAVAVEGHGWQLSFWQW